MFRNLQNPQQGPRTWGGFNSSLVTRCQKQRQRGCLGFNHLLHVLQALGVENQLQLVHGI